MSADSKVHDKSGEVSECGIGIYTTRQAFVGFMARGRAEHGDTCFFDFKKTPYQISFSDDFWLAFENKWQGFFHIDNIECDGKRVCFHSNSWHELVYPVRPRAPFAGFTYRVPVGDLLMVCGDDIERVTISNSFGGHVTIGNVGTFVTRTSEGRYSIERLRVIWQKAEEETRKKT